MAKQKQNKAEKTPSESIFDLTEILILIENGETYRNIAAKYNTNLSRLYRFLSDEKHSARVKLALEQSADTYYDKAEEALHALQSKGTQADIARQRDLAQFYARKAGKRNPKVYGERIHQEHSGTLETNMPSLIIPGLAADDKSTGNS